MSIMWYDTMKLRMDSKKEEDEGMGTNSGSRNARGENTKKTPFSNTKSTLKKGTTFIKNVRDEIRVIALSAVLLAAVMSLQDSIRHLIRYGLHTVVDKWTRFSTGTTIESVISACITLLLVGIVVAVYRPTMSDAVDQKKKALE